MSSHIRPNLKIDGWKFDFDTNGSTYRTNKGLIKIHKNNKNAKRITNVEFI